MKEKKIPIGEYYYAREDGTIVSKYGGKVKERKQHIRGHGYSCVSISTEKFVTKNFNVHTLMALAFYGEPNGMEVRHLDGNRLNNNISNLKYGTTSENQMDRAEHGTCNSGESHGCSILTWEDVREIRSRYVKGKYGYIRLSNDYNVSPSTIQCIITGKTWIE